MCQLTIINSLNNLDLVPKILLPLLYENSMQNRDGTGIYSYDTNTIFKSKDTAADILPDLYKFLLNNKSNTYLAHVRLASVNKNKITDEFSHPFNTDNYIVFHNGTFDYYNKIADSTDTLEFAKELSNNYDKDIIKAFNNTYKGGKYALFVVDKNTNKIYVIRGNTAKLHYFKLRIFDNEVTVINTDYFTFDKTVDYLSMFVSLFYHKDMGEIIDSKELDMNTCYEFNINNGELIKIGAVKEEYKEVVVPNYNFTSNTAYTSGYNTVYKTNNTTYDKSLDIDIASKIKNDLKLTVFEVDLLLKKNYDLNIYHLVNTDKLKELYSKLKPHYSNEKYLVWKNILKRSDEFILDIYRNNNLVVPYFMNSLDDLKKCLI